MSDSNEFSLWLADEEDLLGSVENQMHELKSCSSSYSSQGILDKYDNFSNEVSFNAAPMIDNMTSVSKSCGSLASESLKKNPISRSLSCLALDSSPKDQLTNKITQCVTFLSRPVHMEAPKAAVTFGASKEEYLEEINNRLIRELEEKNATLLQLQENYEHLLLKYAEAQNKIDDLRFQSSGDKNGDVSNRQKIRPKMPVKNILKPPIFSSKLIDSKKMTEEKVKADRPSTLPVDMSSRINHKDVLKAVTPTDSEGVSSVITSMSGHSKILTNFDDKDEEKTNKTILKSDVLEKSLLVNDPYDKVKHWQNSLPPLELIERPDMALFDAEPDAITSLSTRYHELPVSELENIPEAPEWPGQQSKVVSQVSMKKYLRTLSLPSSLTRRNILSQIYKRRNNHTIDISSPMSREPQNEDVVTSPSPRSASPLIDKETNNPSDANIILRRWKRPPFLRSASLPMYHYDSPRSVLHCDIPPLDLENLNLTDDETSPVSNSNIASSSSFFSSHECSFQTLNSLNSCKATVSDYSPTLNSYSETLAVNKSKSIAPDRNNQIFFQDESDCEPDSCNVCGEMLLSVKAASFHGIPKKQAGSDLNLPICRSFSFNTESTAPTPAVTTFSGRESFEVYTNNLKARSQITMKALTAHVNNS